MLCCEALSLIYIHNKIRKSNVHPSSFLFVFGFRRHDVWDLCGICLSAAYETMFEKHSSRQFSTKKTLLGGGRHTTPTSPLTLTLIAYNARALPYAFRGVCVSYHYTSSSYSYSYSTFELIQFTPKSPRNIVRGRALESCELGSTPYHHPCHVHQPSISSPSHPTGRQPIRR